MNSYAPIPMVPGPVSIPRHILQAFSRDFASGDLEADFLPFYHETCDRIGRVMNTKNDVVLMTGEGMLALWSALKSCLAPGDTVLSVGTGLFGDGIGDMAAGLGCTNIKVSLPYDSTIGCADSLSRIEEAIRLHKPAMITAVHCETPSGTLNPLRQLGALKKQYGVPLLYVDAVASIGGTAVDADACHIDLLLGGSQKCFSAPPSMSIIAVSPAAWEKAAQVNYQGYDALLPFRCLTQTGSYPYTPNWHGIAALNAAAQAMLTEGLAPCFARHAAVADQCRQGLQAMGIRLFPSPEAVPSPTVTAAYVPEGIEWPVWDARLRSHGLVAGGSYGPMAGKVFRLGHMGAQACPELMAKALDAVAHALGR